ncbi:MAG: type II secretion system F family protein, partial [Actinomycetota bacterium]
VSNPEFKGVTDVGKGTRTSNRLVKAFDRVVVSPVWYTLMLGLLFLAVSLLAVAGLSLLLFSRSSLKKQISFYEKVANKYRRAPKESSRETKNAYGETKKETKVDEAKILEEAIGMTRFLAEKRGFIDTIQLLLIQAELPLKPAEFIFFHFTGVLVMGLLAFLLSKSLLVTMLFIILAVALPLAYVYNLISKRKRAFHEQLPDMLALIAGSLKAGFGLLQAIKVASEEMASPASSELKKVLAEANLGLPLEEALDGMAARIGSENLSWAVMAIKIHREVGGNLAELLQTLAGTIRERDRISRQIKVLTAEGKLSAIILFILPLILGLVFLIINRPYVSLLFTTTVGLIMVSIATILMIIGGLWFRKIVSIEV